MNNQTDFQRKLVQSLARAMALSATRSTERQFNYIRLVNQVLNSPEPVSGPKEAHNEQK